MRREIIRQEREQLMTPLAFPKPEKRVKKPKRLNPGGKKADQWEKTRADLIVRFEQAGITRCEMQGPGCFRNNFLSFAHSKKRRYITSQDELEEVALLCQKCHHRAEYDPDMYNIISGIIARRKVQP